MGKSRNNWRYQDDNESEDNRRRQRDEQRRRKQENREKAFVVDVEREETRSKTSF